MSFKSLTTHIYAHTRVVLALAGLICVALILVLNQITAEAKKPLPPRHERPAPLQNAVVSEADGAYIALQLSRAHADEWTVVQWQDPRGYWHDVDGWRNLAQTNAPIRWWVAEKDRGTGPFRWIVYRGARTDVPIWKSESFHLPMQGYELTLVQP